MLSKLKHTFGGAALGVIAAFILFPAVASAEVTVDLDGAGEGTVTSDPPDLIDCGNVGGGEPGPTCTIPDFGHIGELTLTATPAPGSSFSHWTGSFTAGTCESGSANPCSFEVSLGDVSTTATFTLAATPPSATIDEVDPSGVGAETALLTGEVNPNGDELTDCRFEAVALDDPDGFSSSEVRSANCDPDPGDGTDPVEVEATVAGLAPNTAYRARLFADKSGADAAIDETDDPFQTPVAPPQVTTDLAAHVDTSTAVLQARVNPRNSETTYFFEYGTDGSLDNQVPATPASAGAGNQPQVVSEEVTGLEPDTTYAFRLVAQNDNDPADVVAGSEESFSTQPDTPRLQPARAYELVSNAHRAGVGIIPGGRMSADGNRVVYPEILPTPGSEGSDALGHFMAERDPADGWRDIFEPSAIGFWDDSAWHGASLGYSRDLQHVVANTHVPHGPDDGNGSPDALPLTGEDVYLREPGGEQRWLSRDPRIAPGTSQVDPLNAAYDTTSGYFGISDGANHVAFSSARSLSDEHPGGSQSQLYLWERGEGAVFAGTRDDGTATTSGSQLGSGRYRWNAMARDGSRLVFSAQRPGNTGTALYIREDSVPPEVTEASREQGLDDTLTGQHPREVDYWGADTEVTRVFFTSASRLTPDSGASHSGNDHSDLYTYDVEEGVLKNLTPRLDGEMDTTPSSDPDPPAVADRARVRGVLRASDDARRIYFVADAQLPAEPSPSGETPSPDGRNLYLLELSGDGEPVESRFIGALAPADGFGSRSIWGDTYSGQRAMSRDGSVLAFRSAAALTSAPTGGRNQVYVYERDRHALRCASCPSDGSTPEGDGRLFTEGTTNFTQAVSDDGTVVFSSTTSLVPKDVNSVRDVYEYRRGAVRLVSAGTGTAGSLTSQISLDGRTLSFLTQDELVEEDTVSGVTKMYVARVGGGFAPPPTPLAPCSGEGCRGDEAEEPGEIASGSGSFRGWGNHAGRARTCRPEIQRFRRGLIAHRRVVRRFRMYRRVVMRTDRGNRAAVRRLRVRARTGRVAVRRSALAARACLREGGDS